MRSLSNHPLGIVLCCSILVGCISIQETNTLGPVVRTTQDNNAAATDRGSVRPYLSKASAYETKGDLQMAFYYLKIASSLSPGNKEISKKKTALKKRMGKKADLYFQEGIKLYRRQQMDKARQAFLNSLRYDPEHKKALDYLNSKFSPFKSVSYKVEKGETKTDIANKVFHDPDKAFLISYFYEETGNQKVLQKGMMLELPYLASIPVYPQIKKPQQPRETAPPVQEAKKDQQPSETPPEIPPEKAFLPVYNVESELAKAEELLKERRYDRALLIADEILDYDYLNLKVEGFINRVYYQKGKNLFDRERYLEAQTIFGYVDPEYIPTEEILAEIKTILRKQAENHYLKGVKYFINEELEKAILEWETVLKMNPEHEKAQSDIQNANQLLEKLKVIQEPGG